MLRPAPVNQPVKEGNVLEADLSIASRETRRVNVSTRLVPRKNATTSENANKMNLGRRG